MILPNNGFCVIILVNLWWELFKKYLEVAVVVQSVIKDYGGRAMLVPLAGRVRKGRGDDITVVVNHELNSDFGCLDIDLYKVDYELAKKLALSRKSRRYGCPVMAAIQDPESGSPMILARRVERDGVPFYLGVIFNAAFSTPYENRRGSYCLRMTREVDPRQVFSERIKFEPGEIIAWTPDQLKMLNLDR